jgi:proteasome lid subunit RPN8/RPN11
MELYRRHLSALWALAAAGREEACGVLIGQRRPQIRITAIVAGHNVHPTPQQHFLLDARTLLEADAAALASGCAIVGFYHSHPSGTALPSRHDRRDAWPGHVYLIVAAGSPMYACAWLCDPKGTFTPEPIVPLQPEAGQEPV